jgi:putative polyhydroxyalkanoate system protein
VPQRGAAQYRIDQPLSPPTMAHLLIEREHQLGLEQARRTATQWVQEAEQKFDMRCTYLQGEHGDEVSFARSGLSGTLQVSATTFRMQAQLGFLLGAFKDRIEAEIQKNLDALIASHAKV